MLIIPAIDLKEGSCVRLYKGLFNRELFKRDPIEVAERFKEAGAKRLHIVDLDGAKIGHPVNLELALKIKKITELEIEFGGGIRDIPTLKEMLKTDIDYIIIGTLALSNEIEKLVEERERIIVSIDIDQNGFVKSHGWEKRSNFKGWELMKRLQEIGFNDFIITLTHRDGTLEGIEENLLKEFSRGPKTRIIFAGGVSTPRDIEILKKSGAYGVIIGRAFYERKLPLEVIRDAC